MLNRLFKFGNHRSDGSFQVELECLQSFRFRLVLFREDRVRWSDTGGNDGHRESQRHRDKAITSEWP